MTQAPTSESRPLCRHAQCADHADRCLIADLAWSERHRLLAIARHRVASAAEAEDVVSEAMTRALECPDVDPARAAAWLTAVTIRLCIDHGRERARAPKRWLYSVQTYSRTHEFEADVIDTLSAAAIAPLLDDMPPQQRRALQLRADGESVAAIATAMSLSDKAVESLLGRARAAAKTIVAGLGSGAAMAAGLVRRPSPTPAPATVSTVMAFALTTIVAAHLGGPPADGAPSASHHSGSITTANEPSPPLRGLAVNVQAAVEVSPPVVSLGSSRPSSTVVRPGREVTVGVVRMHDSGSGRVDSDETPVESLRACIEQGIEISPSYIGCRSAKP